MTGADSTTAKSAGSSATGRVAYFHLASLAVYAFVALLAAALGGAFVRWRYEETSRKCQAPEVAA